jgi:hypothetical protein
VLELCEEDDLEQNVISALAALFGPRLTLPLVRHSKSHSRDMYTFL